MAAEVPMAIVRIDFVEKQLKAICKASQQVKNLVKQALETVEQDPAAYPALADVPKDLVAQEGVFLRKVKIVHQKHDYRMVYLHRRREDGEEQADFLYVRPREDDYRSLDWDRLREFLLEE
jgi:hypothetical protein